MKGKVYISQLSGGLLHTKKNIYLTLTEIWESQYLDRRDRTGRWWWGRRNWARISGRDIPLWCIGRSVVRQLALYQICYGHQHWAKLFIVKLTTTPTLPGTSSDYNCRLGVKADHDNWAKLAKLLKCNFVYKSEIIGIECFLFSFPTNLTPRSVNKKEQRVLPPTKVPGQRSSWGW